jgi:hypothetical protein
VGSIFRKRWCVLSTCLYPPQLRERIEQRSGDFGIARPGGVAVLNIQLSCIGHLMSHGMPSLHAYPFGFRHPQPRSPSADKRPTL